jgi:hypothetical protein
MDKETVKQAVELINEKGERIRDVARKLGVSQRELRTEISTYSGDFEQCTVEIIADMNETLGITAYKALPEIINVIRKKLYDPFSSLGEITGAARLFYDIYKKESDSGSEDGSDPISRLFGDDIKQLSAPVDTRCFASAPKNPTP